MLLSACLAFLPAQSTGQTGTTPAYGTDCPSSATSVSELMETGRALRAKGEAEKGLHCLARAADLAAGSRDAKSEAEARSAFATMAVNSFRLDLAAAQATRANELCVALGNQLCSARMTRLLGNLAYTKGTYPESERLYKIATEMFAVLGADRDHAIALHDGSRLVKGEPRDRMLEEALALARKIGALDLEASILHSRSDHHFSAGRFDAAVADLLVVIEKFEGLGDTERLSDANVSLGRIMRAHGRNEEAIRYYDRAIALQEKSPDFRSRVQSLNAKGIALTNLGRHAEARVVSERALEVAKESGVSRLIDFQLGNLASVYGQEGDYPRAIAILEDVVQREPDPYMLGYRHGTLAQYRRKTKDTALAVNHIQRAIENARTANNNDYLPSLLQWAAGIYREAGRTDDALAAASEGVATVDKVRARLVPTDYMKRGFGERWQELYGETIAILHQRGEHARALTTGEQARARAFLDLLASRDLVDREVAADDGGVDLRKGAVSSRAAASAANATEIAATASRLSSIIVSYWVTADEMFIWVTPPAKPTQAARVPIAKKDLERLVAAAVPAPGSQTTEALAKLHATLIAPVRQWLPAGTALTIIPHGPLFRVSFAALPDKAGVYLIERHAISYAPSISTLTFTEKRLAVTKAGTDRRFLLVADPSPLPKLTPALAVLPAARRETSEIARLVGARRAVVLEGPRAGEDQVRTSMAQSRVVHFATHGVIRDDEPFDSFLALGAGSTGASSDGRLTVAELYSLDLKAELVVLSACRTATGPPSGDGISGLSRALFSAGASSVLATLWDVADEPSAMLMAGFYRHWQAGLNKRTALRQAQLDLLGALRAGKVTVKTRLGTVPLDEQPHYWAGYILVGES